MRVQILSLNDEKIRFILSGVTTALANALRRTIISEVPCMAIDDMFVFDNSSVIHDEVLAHRIGLVPIKTDLDRYVLPEDCECGSELGCEKCRVVLTLDVEAETDARIILSGDFVSEDPEVVPVSPDIPLTKVTTGQAVRVEAYARLGQGKIHAKWQPVSSATYQHVAEIDVDEERCTACGECVKSCPKDVFTIKEGKLRIVDVNSCILCGECVKACPVDPTAVTQAAKPDSYLFTVESTGCLPPERLVFEAGKILVAKLDEFSEKIEKGETDDIIAGFEPVEQQARGLYSVGSGDLDDDEEEEDEEP
ncbi:MAG: DNA-directed RNA polymerase subunit D [Candidatus Bathyarchaeota archaeon]|nr:MAG: DNA-directed RNA polymerase subunit D [Candidatus Bathyarchaeota archaeon]